MALKKDLADVYHAIGVKPIISARGTTTASGGTKLRPEVIEVMAKASRVMVDIPELNAAAGKVIAEITGAEAGFVSSGAAGGLVLQAAAVIAGSEPAKMAQLPDTTGLKDEIVIQNSHRFAYDQAYRVAGATLVGVGSGKSCEPWELEAAFNERTAAVAYLVSPFTSRRAMSLSRACEIAHAHGLPVIVDAASTLPPRDHLRKFTREGADMVIYSGGKGVRGPQGTGILCGRADLIEAAAANASPFQFVGRGMKVAKEEIVGLITGLRIFVEEDEEAQTARYREMGSQIVDALIELPGLEIEIKQDGIDYMVPNTVMTFTDEWRGLSRDDVLENMRQGDVPIYLSDLGNPDEMAVEPTNLDEDELRLLITRLHQELTKPAMD